MAGASTFHPFLSTISFPTSSSSRVQRLPFSTSRPPALRAHPFRLRRRVKATTDGDEWRVGRDEPGYNTSPLGVEEMKKERGERVVCTPDELKQRLKEKLYGTDRGLNASSDTRAEIVELITQLEALNPNPAPTEALSLLNGKWILAYTSFSGLFPLLAIGKVPRLVEVEEISQTIDAEAFTVQNSIKFRGLLASSSLTTNAKFEVRSPKRVQIKFEEGIIGTPQLTDSIVIPEKMELFGQNIDLSPLKSVFASIQDAASSVAKTVSEQPPLKIPITNDNAQSWLLTTYLDDELRISRGDGSGVLMLVKEGCWLLD